MNRESIIRMARDAGLIPGPSPTEALERFANFVAAEEREACARLCDAEWSTFEEKRHGNALADSIRARGQK